MTKRRVIRKMTTDRRVNRMGDSDQEDHGARWPDSSVRSSYFFKQAPDSLNLEQVDKLS